MELTDNQRNLIRVSVLEASRGARALAQAEICEGSLAALVFEAPLNALLDGVAPPGTPIAAAKLAVLAAVEMAAAYVDSIKQRRRSVSLAPLVRSSAEAFAKAHYLLATGSESETIRRYVLLTIDELKFPVRNSEFQTIDGVAVDGRAHHEAFKKVLSQLPVGAALPGESARVEALLNVESDATPAIYSQLSGVAHSATSAIGMFLDPSNGELRLPAGIAVEYCGYIYAASVAVARDIIAAYGVEGPDLERWHASHQRAERAILALQQSL